MTGSQNRSIRKESITGYELAQGRSITGFDVMSAHFTDKNGNSLGTFSTFGPAIELTKDMSKRTITTY